MFAPRQIEADQRLNLKQRLVVLGMNVMLLAALTGAMYLGHQQPDDLTAVFLRTFLPIAVGTVVVARILIRKLQAARRASVGTECND